MAFFWLLMAIMGLVGDSGMFYSLAKTHGGVAEYAITGGSVLFNVALLYAAVVEGSMLAYIIVAMALYRVITGVYSMISKNFLVGGIQLGVGLLFLYWGYQRLTAPAIPMMTAGRRHWRR